MKYLIGALLLFSLGCAHTNYKVGSCILYKRQGSIWVVLEVGKYSYLLRNTEAPQIQSTLSFDQAYWLFDQVDCYPMRNM